MNNKFYISLVIILLLLSCSKSTTDLEIENLSSEILFSTKELVADWPNITRGFAVNDFDSVSSIMAYAFISEPGSNITGCYIDNKEATQNSGVWSFTPTYYYPLNESLDFLAYIPKVSYSSDEDNNGIIHQLDFKNKSINFSYYLPNIGRNHPDLLLATPIKGCNSSNMLKDVEFNHVLTQLTMSAKVSDNTEQDRFAITRFTINNIAIGADLNYSVNNGIGAWSQISEGSFIASEIMPDVILGEDRILLNNTLTSVMSKGHSLFMIPQEIESREVKPTIQITVLDTKLDATYITDKISLPSPNKKGWLMGQHVNLQFELNIDKSGIVIPMSFVARLFDWQEQDINVELDENIFATLDRSSVAANTSSTLTLYTNGAVKSVECDGSIITAAILAQSAENFYYPIDIVTAGSGLGNITVKIENSNSITITKTFNINVN